MFSFKRRLTESGIFNGMYDVHTHILPNVDDGVRSEQEALSILSYYEELGMQRVIFTPHIMEDMLGNSTDSLLDRFSQFQTLYKGNIELSLGAEYMLDGKFTHHLKSGELLTLFDNYLLVEMSYMVATYNIRSIIAEIMSRGYFVVLAHPERYLYLSRNDYKELKNSGVRFQLNLTALFGSYGNKVQDCAQWLLENSYYDFIGTDIHSLNYHTKVFSNAKLSKTHIRQIQSVCDNSKELMGI